MVFPLCSIFCNFIINTLGIHLFLLFFCLGLFFLVVRGPSPCESLCLFTPVGNMLLQLTLEQHVGLHLHVPTYRRFYFSMNILLTVHIPWFCIFRCNQLRFENSIFLSEVGNPQVQRANRMHCSIYYFI